jgi:hypothetical protein
VLDAPPPAARPVNALLTRLYVTFIVVMTRHAPDPGDQVAPLLSWFDAAMNEHKHDLALTIEGLSDATWRRPTSRRRAARRLIQTWERNGVAAFSYLSAFPAHKPVAG